MRPLALAIASFSAVAVLATVSLDAHPAASSEVLLTFESRDSFSLALISDAEALVVKLEVLTGIETDPLTPAAARLQRLSVAARPFLTLDADGLPVALSSPIVRPAAAGPDGRTRTSLEFTARLPPGARAVSFRTRLIFGAYPFVVRHEDDGTEAFTWVSGSDASDPIPLGPVAGGRWWRDSAGAIAVGFEHVVPRGLDHILFVLGLFLFAPRVGPVLAQVTTFTVAHSATLALSTIGWVSLPGTVVEPLIALSIVYIAVENLSAATLTWRRLALVGAFGLLHGLGFAGALGALDLGALSASATLVGFNLGVEAGQLAVIAAAALAVGAVGRAGLDARVVVARPASLVIGLAGLYWVIERTAGA